MFNEPFNKKYLSTEIGHIIFKKILERGDFYNFLEKEYLGLK